MFFLSQSRKEIREIIEENPAGNDATWYRDLIEDLNNSMGMYIHYEGPFPGVPDSEKKVINFNMIAGWAERDWTRAYRYLKGSWLVVFVSRGGMILLDLIESKIDDFIWTYIKPKTFAKPHEDLDIYEEYTDPLLEDKLAEFAKSTVNLLLIDDVVNETENIESVYDTVIEKCDEMQIEVLDVAVLALLTRMERIGTIPVFGTLVSYNGSIEVDWGNDLEDRLDYKDFTEIKEYIDER